jgi:histidine triad (HIT) family protein
MATDCLFCKIVARQIPGQIVHENDHVLAFRDVRPVAPTHVLVIPKKHVTGIHDAGRDDAEVLAEVLLAARDVAEQLGLGKDGYRLVVNQGPNAGQSVAHLHVHVLGGRTLTWPPG